MILRCTDCASSVPVGDGGTESWRYPLWDHLLDYHPSQVADSTHTKIRFVGNGISANVTEFIPARQAS